MFSNLVRTVTGSMTSLLADAPLALSQPVVTRIGSPRVVQEGSTRLKHDIPALTAIARRTPPCRVPLALRAEKLCFQSRELEGGSQCAAGSKRPTGSWS